MPLVSVIIPIYNKKESIHQTIKCVLSQTFKNFELILINDGSSDGSGDIAINYQEVDSRINYYYQENKGVSITRNKGIDLAKGKYITFLDADDRWKENFLEEMVNGIGDGNVCYCGHFYVRNSKSKKAKIKFLNGDIVESYVRNMTTPNTNSWLIKKDFINKFNIRFPVDLNWGEDMTFFFKLLVHDLNVTCVNKYLTEYHMSNINSLSENSLDKIEKDIIWMERAKGYALKNIDSKSRKENIVKYFDSYRIPASIIYRILNNLPLTKSDKDNLAQTYEQYINKITISNGLRSLKLLYYKNFVYMHLRK